MAVSRRIAPTYRQISVVLDAAVRQTPPMSYPPPAGQPHPNDPNQPQQPTAAQPPAAAPPPGAYPAAAAYSAGQVGYQPSQQTPPVPTQPKRPWNVTLVAIIALLIGIIDVLAGVGALIFRNERRLQVEVGLTSTNLAIYGAVILIVGAIVLLLSFGLFGGSRLSRGVIAFLAVLRIALSVVGIVLATTTNARSAFTFDILWSVIVLLLLFAGARTKVFFARG